MEKTARAKIERKQVAEIVRNGRKILLITHYNPDSDAIGSLAAFGHIAEALGKEFRLYCVSSVPYFLDWVKLPGFLYNKLADLHAWVPDLIVFLDCGDERRAGKEAAGIVNGELPSPQWNDALTLCLDHHAGNPHFAAYNWIEPHFAATAQMVGFLAEELGLGLGGGLGESVYLGLSGDSGNFRYGNTSAELLELAARIVRAGLNVGDFNEKNGHNWTEKRMKLWGLLLQDLRFDPALRVITSVVKSDCHRRCGTGPADLEGFVSFIRMVKGAEISLLVSERLDGTSKISLRSAGDADIRSVAEVFGGGGHKNAAGAEMDMAPEDAAAAVLAELARVCHPIGVVA